MFHLCGTVGIAGRWSQGFPANARQSNPRDAKGTRCDEVPQSTSLNSQPVSPVPYPVWHWKSMRSYHSRASKLSQSFSARNTGSECLMTRPSLRSSREVQATKSSASKTWVLSATSNDTRLQFGANRLPHMLSALAGVFRTNPGNPGCGLACGLILTIRASCRHGNDLSEQTNNPSIFVGHSRKFPFRGEQLSSQVGQPDQVSHVHTNRIRDRVEGRAVHPVRTRVDG